MNKAFAVLAGVLVLATQGAGAVEYTGVMQTIPSTSIKFAHGNAVLSEADKATLRNLVNQAREKGVIDQVTVAAWADKALPAKGKKLTDTDRDLAQHRADAIKEYLKEAMKVSDVDTYNMAEDSNWLAKTFNTTDAELKAMFQKKNASIPITNAEHQIIRNEGGPSVAMIVVEKKIK